MKFKSTKLYGNGNYLLVKYTDNHKLQLERFKKLNSDLAKDVEVYPSIYSEDSEYQSYIISKGINNCVGIIAIETNPFYNDLLIKLQIDENKFNNECEIVTFIDQLVDNIGVRFYKKNKINILLSNDIDLSKYNDKYTSNHKIINNQLIEVYSYSNVYNNTLYTALINEMVSANDELTNLGQSWTEKINNSSIEYDLNNGYTPDIAELLYSCESISWNDIRSKKGTKKRITFSKDGNITYDKIAPHYGKMSYRFDYNLMSNGFTLKNRYFLVDNSIEIINNNSYAEIKYKNLSVKYIKETNEKVLEYKPPTSNNSSIDTTLWLKEDNIEKCYIDFNTHKNDGRINGKYSLRIRPSHDSDNKQFTLNFASRKGMKGRDFSNILLKEDEELFTQIISGELTYDLINELIEKVISIITDNKLYYNKQKIDIEKTYIDFYSIEKEVFNFISGIKGELPLPHLKNIVQNFVDEYRLNLEDTVQFKLKK